MDGLSGKIFIVTGGSGLLGKHILEFLSNQGARVFNFDLHESDSKGSHFVKCDITDPQSVQDSLAGLLKTHSVIDGLVNNAYPRTSDWGNKFENIELSSWKTNVDVQLNSYFYFSQQVSLQMIKQGFGSIVNIASIYGVVGPDFGVYDGTDMTMPAAYSAIKGGIINFTRYLSSYLGRHQIRVNSVSPGGIFDHQNSVFVNQYNQKTPLGRMGKAEEIAPTVAFLLSDHASYITGQNICIDGGWTAI
jgi:NAD(P)-dependent dehydrogenase (short-subunit alcohol dehydrogenase family)